MKVGIRGKAVLVIHLHFITAQLHSPTWKRRVEEAGGAHDCMESILDEGQTVMNSSGEKQSLGVHRGLVLNLVLFNEMKDGVNMG